MIFKKFLDLFILLFDVSERFASMVCTTCVPGTREGQKEALGLLGLKLQMTVSHRIGSEN